MGRYVAYKHARKGHRSPHDDAPISTFQQSGAVQRPYATRLKFSSIAGCCTVLLLLLYCTVLYCTIVLLLYCTVLYCTVLYCRGRWMRPHAHSAFYRSSSETVRELY